MKKFLSQFVIRNYVFASSSCFGMPNCLHTRDSSKILVSRFPSHLVVKVFLSCHTWVLWTTDRFYMFLCFSPPPVQCRIFGGSKKTGKPSIGRLTDRSILRALLLLFSWKNIWWILQSFSMHALLVLVCGYFIPVTGPFRFNFRPNSHMPYGRRRRRQRQPWRRPRQRQRWQQQR